MLKAMGYFVPSCSKPVQALFCLLMSGLFLGCSERKGDSPKVNYAGALRTVMSSDLSSKVSLDTLSNKSNLYALGAVEGLRGEILVFDEEPLIASVKGNHVAMNDSFDVSAALLVYTQVSEWKEVKVPISVQTLVDLEQFLIEVAQREGVDIKKPFPFLLEGKARSVSWHVIDWPEGDIKHTHEKHKTAGLNGVLDEILVSVLGFYSVSHKGIFTHHSSNMHMHFKTTDDGLAGHVDALRLGKNMLLKIPNI